VNKKIIIIDDEKSIVGSMVYYFSKKGYDVEGFTSPEEAITAIAQNGFGIVITDLHMEPISGFEIINIVRKNSPKSLLIAMSGKYTHQDIEGLDIDYFFEKPFLFKDLEKVIGDYISPKKTY
jgi:DNA-binding response OmpR family regulator